MSPYVRGTLDRAREHWLAVAAFVAVLAAWEAVVRTARIPPFVLPAPSAIFAKAVADVVLLRQKPKDLEGKSVGHPPASTTKNILDAGLKLNGVDLAKVKVVNHPAGGEFQLLAAGKSEATRLVLKHRPDRDMLEASKFKMILAENRADEARQRGVRRHDRGEVAEVDGHPRARRDHGTAAQSEGGLHEHASPRGEAPIEALRTFDLEVDEAEFVSIIGVSGCGKSTLLRATGDILQPSRGSIRIAGREPGELRNVAFLRELTGRPYPRGRVDELVRLVGLEDFETRRPAELSGGMQQRTAIARALALSPWLLLMDEPFGALDEITRDRMSEELLKIWAASRVTVLFVTHSIPEAVFLSDRVVVMTPRPGTIQRIVDIKLPRPRDRSLKLSDDFMDHVRVLHTELYKSMGT